MTTDERIDAVAAYGFTRRQAAFLTTVILHSGVCLPRQYTRFAGIVFGHTTRDFFARLTARKFATAYECWRRGGTYYHIHHKGLYAAVGEPDNRNRRRPTIPRTAERLMLLDVVLGEPQIRWLATERDKQVFFLTERVSPQQLAAMPKAQVQVALAPQGHLRIVGTGGPSGLDMNGLIEKIQTQGLIVEE